MNTPKLNLRAPALVVWLFLIGILASCGGEKKENGKETSSETEESGMGTLSPDLEKYCGYYAVAKHDGSYDETLIIGKFPANSKIHTKEGDKYVPIGDDLLGKYFIADDNEYFLYETNKYTDFAGGYVIAPEGWIISGINEKLEIYGIPYINSKDGINVGIGHKDYKPEKYCTLEKDEEGHYTIKRNVTNPRPYQWLRPLNSEPESAFKDSKGENTQEEGTNGSVVYYKIQDPDGYTNLRDWPNGKILKRVYPNEKIEVIGTEGDCKQVKLQDGTTGYIHSSRLVKY
jgi:hypothetical protein